MGKISYIVPYPFIPPSNGGRRAAYGFAECLAQKRELVIFATYEDEKAPAPFTVKGLFPDKPYKYFSPAVAGRFWRSLRRNRPQLIILHQHFMGLLLVPIAGLLRIPLSVYVQNLEYRRFRSLGKWWWLLMFLFEAWVYRRCRYLFFISPDEVEPASRVFRLPREKCRVVPYGTNLKTSPPPDLQTGARIRERHGFEKNERLILFFGPQSYQPNLEAVERIARYIAPALAKQTSLSFRFLICGGGLPASHDWLRQAPWITYLGYVPEIEEYVLAADLVINPVNSGGGVKTKLIEAIALGKTVISSETGALGVEAEKCGNKLIRVPDEDYAAFAAAIIQELETANSPTPTAFYDTYYWGRAIEAVLAVTE